MAGDKSQQTAPLPSELAGSAEEDTEFSKLLKRSVFPSGNVEDEKTRQLDSVVHQLAQEALKDADLRKGDVNKTIKALMAKIDVKIGKQLDKILHEPDFQQMEGAWRGLKYLVSNTETDETLQIKVLHVSKPEMRKMFDKFEGTDWDQSPLFKQIYEAEYGRLGGEPFGCLIGDYQFNHDAPDMKVLKGITQIAAASHAPFITSPSPEIFGMQSWQQLPDPKDLTAKTLGPEHAEWRAFRETEDSRYVAMAMPRFLARMPYGAKTNPVDGLGYEEEAVGGTHQQYTWANSAYAMGANITRAFKRSGWCTNIRGLESGTVANLPTHTFATDDGGVDMKCPTEIGISERRDNELAKNGLMPLIHSKNSNFAAFLGADTLHKPPKFDDAAVSGNARLGARLPYIFATTRFAHYLKIMVRAKIGQFQSPKSMQKYLEEWILNYVCEDPALAAPETLAKKPLAGAEVLVMENPENPGFYTSEFYLKPHYQLEGMNIGLRLVTQLPSQQQS